MTEREKYLFDLWGYVVIEDALSEEELTAANAAIAHHSDLIENREPGLSEGHADLKGQSGRGELTQNPLTFEHPWCDPFRNMLTHPKTVDVFNEILGIGFRLDHGPGLITMDNGTEGHRFHGGSTFDPSQFHHFYHEQIHCGLTVAAWQLAEIKPGDGGFACIPGSHKANYRTPMSVLTLKENWDCIKQISAPAGSLIVFTEALIHGTLPWIPADRERRSILFKYAPGYLAWGSAFTECPIQDPTIAELAMFEPPHRPGRVTLGDDPRST